ncbi:DUF7269 family protein [Halocalculus aciditolerans]|uniref:Uncharacterized protein n=1 Tax=Halocalculus aciditolerans TaxID=1383812 RepID=A0A830F7Y2_9EURY|nr:hypothetical protein [Halocalculus aciditolerans]GGL63533.1 hypothetical protein GCM10009039_21820 [Halocalculus aciditolerans]
MARRVTLAVGVLVVAVGVAGTLAPAVVAGVPLSASFIVAVGVFAALAALRAGSRRRKIEVDYADLPGDGPAPEAARPPRALGEDVVEDLETVSHPRRRAQRDQLRTRLREDAVAALVARGNSREDARAAVDSGAWTDDTLAAAFFDANTSVPLATSLRLSLRGATFETQVAHVAAELDRLTEVSA